jgi:hypothetical protein
MRVGYDVRRRYKGTLGSGNDELDLHAAIRRETSHQIITPGLSALDQLICAGQAASRNRQGYAASAQIPRYRFCTLQ